MDETFCHHLVEGRPFLQFDNVRGRLDSATLESFLTADKSFSARIPFRGSVDVDPSKSVVFISSNGFETTRDMANRSSIIRILKRENYDFELFQGLDLLEFVRSAQPLLLGAVFAVVEEWVNRGKPTTKETRHDFREWCQSLDWIVQNIFNEPPLMDGHQEAKERTANPNLTFVRSLALIVQGANKLGERLIASSLAEMCFEENLQIPGLAEGSKDIDAAKKQMGKIMKSIFGEKQGIHVDNFTIQRVQTTSTNSSGNPQVQLTYTFSLADGEQR